jgi:hypothetical protein
MLGGMLLGDARSIHRVSKPGVDEQRPYLGSSVGNAFGEVG